MAGAAFKRTTNSLHILLLTVLMVFGPIVDVPLSDTDVEAENAPDVFGEFDPVDAQPELTHYQKPKYGRRDRKANLDGLTWIKALVDEEGRVTEACVYISSGHASLDGYAVEAAFICRFRPALVADVPVSKWVVYLVPFGERFDRFEPGRLVTDNEEPDSCPVFTAAELQDSLSSDNACVLPEMVYYQTPEYPEYCALTRTEGLVWVQALVWRDGSVRDATMYRSSGSRFLDRAALEAAPLCRFKPAMQDGLPIAVWVTWKVNFEMEN